MEKGGLKKIQNPIWSTIKKKKDIPDKYENTYQYKNKSKKTKIMKSRIINSFP